MWKGLVITRSKGEEYEYTIKSHCDGDQGKGARDTGIGIDVETKYGTA